MKRAIALLLFAHFAFGADASAPRPTIEERFGGTAVVGRIKDAEIVRVWRLEKRKNPISSTEPKRGGPTGYADAVDEAGLLFQARYASVGEGAYVNAGGVSAIKALLLADTSYTVLIDPKTGKPLFKGCGFEPIAKIRFSGRAADVEAWLCFSCSDVVLMGDGKMLGGGEFKPIRRELIAWLKAVLHDDPVITKIPMR